MGQTFVYYYECFRSDIKTVALALAHCNPDDVNSSVSPRDARSPLHLASSLGNLAFVQLLIWVRKYTYLKIVIKLSGYKTIHCQLGPPNKYVHSIFSQMPMLKRSTMKVELASHTPEHRG